MEVFHLKIISCSGTFYDGLCESLILPTEEGEYGIQAKHESMVIGVCIGELRYKAEGQWNSVIIGQGFARSEGNQTILIVDSAEHPEDVDENRAKEAARRAQERLEIQKSRKEYYRGQLAMTRAMTRLKIKEKRFM